jgi:hypothetical protein
MMTESAPEKVKILVNYRKKGETQSLLRYLTFEAPVTQHTLEGVAEAFNVTVDDLMITMDQTALNEPTKNQLN